MKEGGGKERVEKGKEGQMTGENFLSYSSVNFIDPFVKNGGKNDSHRSGGY